MNAVVQAETNALATQQGTQLAVGPMANAIQALQTGMSIEHLQGVMALQKEWEANEARKAYVADMAAFKLNPPTILKTKLVGYKNKDGTHTGYMHATLGSVASAVVEALATHGFSHSWETKQASGIITVNCKITHRLGHCETTCMEAMPDQSGKKNAIQAVASSITYMQRYTLLSACGLATMDMPDDDGRGNEPVDTMGEGGLQHLIDGAMATTSDEAALAYWQKNRALLTVKASYDAFKDAVAQHRQGLRGKSAPAQPRAEQEPSPQLDRFEVIQSMLNDAKTEDQLNVAADWINDLQDPVEVQELNNLYETRAKTLRSKP